MDAADAVQAGPNSGKQKKRKLVALKVDGSNTTIVRTFD
jgi:hypothetical protein